MKRTAAFLVSAVMLAALTGCEDFISANVKQVRDYLDQYYNKSFEYVRTITISGQDSQPIDKCYVFRDEEGITCRAYVNYSGETSGSNVTEDYQVSYLRSHPELLYGFESIGAGHDIVQTSSDVDLNTFTYRIYFDTYDSIDPVVRSASEALRNVPPINPLDTVFVQSPLTVSSITPDVCFVQSGTDTACGRPVEFRIGRQTDYSPEGYISDVQNHYNYGITYAEPVQDYQSEYQESEEEPQEWQEPVYDEGYYGEDYQ